MGWILLGSTFKAMGDALAVRFMALRNSPRVIGELSRANSNPIGH